MKTGNWNDVTTWSCGLIPTSLLNTTIQSGHIVSIPTGVNGQAKTMNVFGNIDFKPNSTLKSN
jgi:endoglucanase